LLRRAHLSGDALELVWRRVLVLTLIAWLPLLALSIAEGRAWGGSVQLPFLMDVDVQGRFLLALRSSSSPNSSSTSACARWWARL
jgi:hypothetical protein